MTEAAEPVDRKRIALLLPLMSEHLAGAAYAVKAGCEAAQRRSDSVLQVAVISTDGHADSELQSYLSAQLEHDIIIGPLSRSSVSLILQQSDIQRPTVVLSPPEIVQVSAVGRQRVLAVGLPIEKEAREMATWLEEEYTGGRVIVVSSGLPWQERAATTFMQQLARGGIKAEYMQLDFDENGLSRRSTQQLARTLKKEQVAGLFAALDVRQVIAVRTATDTPVSIYGTSHLNPYVRTGSQDEPPLMGLDGVRLVDIPWQLQVDHEMVMQYPQMIWPVGLRQGPDLARLYALGIDACRIAGELAAGKQQFDMHGVTGELDISITEGNPAIFQRTHMRAVYRQGVVMPWRSGSPVPVQVR